MNADVAARGVALAGQDLDKLALAVAGDARDSDDLAGAQCERQVAHRRLTGIVEGIEVGDREARLARFPGPRGLDGEFLRADHGARHGVGGQVFDVAGSGQLAAPQDGDFVRIGHHLAELVGDEQDGQVAAFNHAAQHAEHFVGLIGREHRGRLVENEEARAADKAA